MNFSKVCHLTGLTSVEISRHLGVSIHYACKLKHPVHSPKKNATNIYYLKQILPLIERQRAACDAAITYIKSIS